jgi:glutaredoxin
MTEVEIFSRENCPLCDRAYAVLERVAEDIQFVRKVTTLRPGGESHSEYLDHVPVVHVNGTFFSWHRLDEHALREELSQRREGTA